jgi:hypothetical protein
VSGVSWLAPRINSQRESPSLFGRVGVGAFQIGLRGGFRNFVRRGHGETTSWHAMPFWRTVTVSFGCTLRKFSNIESTAFEGSASTFRSQPPWLALVRSGLQYLGWRSASLWLGELTPGYCGNAFGVKNRTAGLNQITTCENTARMAGHYPRL